jgi:hypothetical protein
MTLTLTELQAEIAADPEFRARRPKDWEAEIVRLGVATKFDADLRDLIPQYVAKLALVREALVGDWNVHLTPPVATPGLGTVEELGERLRGALTRVADKQARLLNKLACCLYEQQLRSAQLVTRTPHHTDYYADYANGNDANDGLAANNDHAWKTITKFTTDTVRSAGDRLFLRANTTWTQGTEAKDIIFDEDGTLDAFIEIIGCDATTNDPWNDDSNVLPIIDFEDAAYQASFYSDTYWRIQRVDFRRSNDGNGATALENYSHFCQFVSCRWRDGNGTGIEGLYISSTSGIRCTDCTWQDTNGAAVVISYANCVLSGCTINAGTTDGATYGLIVTSSMVDCQNCSVGTDAVAFGTATIDVRAGGIVRLRNVTWGITPAMVNTGDTLITAEDDDGVFEAQQQWHYAGTIIRATASPRSGGADSYATLTSNASCGPNSPLLLGDRLSGFSALWLGSGVELTISVYARVGSAWDSALTAAEAYLTASYLSNGASAARTTVQSAQQIANDTTWTAFTVTFTPAREGWVYLWFTLAEYEDAGEYVDVDIQPVVS